SGQNNLTISLGTVRPFFFFPLKGYGLEAIRSGLHSLCRPTFFGGVDSLEELPLGIDSKVTCGLNTDLGIGSQGENVLSFLESVFPPPKFAAGGGYFEVEAMPVE